MNDAKIALLAELEAIENAITAHFPAGQAVNVAQPNWTFPGVTLEDLISPLSELKNSLSNKLGDDLGDHEQILQSFLLRFVSLRTHTVPQLWANAGQAVSAYFITMDAFKRVLAPLLKVEDGAGLMGAVQITARQLRAVETRVRDLMARSQDLGSTIDRIEAANDAALQLPEDLESLQEGRDRVRTLIAEAEKDRLHVFSAREAVEGVQRDLSQVVLDTAEVVKKADAAYSAATSQGLAAAFAERSKDLGNSMLIWVLALLSSLACASFFGSTQLVRLSELIKTPGASDAAIAVNLLLSVLSVGAPVWFAWLSTKQVGQRFRLSEDYAFKASVSKAYEGYRREAASIDPNLQVQLLKSALARLDEQPLRFVEPETHGSPWQEALSSDLLKEAAKSIPNFSTHLTAFVSGLLTREKTKSD
ncbi:hypothetical protein [Pseudomonas salomonii]|uniref:Uncharacterized protein n=1 Tax=Pseudomonas salomonii TaxID=191391 RepID=A0ABS9GI14_9PSED|nr:hypothetical protein [Pseudomonas salomonii]MCF5545383.1 hypothetical protein [Pseudomonas salomonii]